VPVRPGLAADSLLRCRGLTPVVQPPPTTDTHRAKGCTLPQRQSFRQVLGVASYPRIPASSASRSKETNAANVSREASSSAAISWRMAS